MSSRYVESFNRFRFAIGEHFTSAQSLSLTAVSGVSHYAFNMTPQPFIYLIYVIFLNHSCYDNLRKQY